MKTTAINFENLNTINNLKTASTLLKKCGLDMLAEKVDLAITVYMLDKGLVSL